MISKDYSYRWQKNNSHEL